MILDEATLPGLLRDATADLAAPSIVVADVRTGGARRLRRRRVAMGTTALAALAILVPTAIALPRIGAGSRTSASNRVSSDLYAKPPTGADPCMSNGGEGHNPASYPKLLMLPPDTSMTYAFTNSGGAPRCNYFPHVAGTIGRLHSDRWYPGAVVYGPNATTAAQQSEPTDPGDFSGQLLHPTVDGATATAYYLPQNETAQVFWTDALGGQWQATTTGLDATRLASFLAGLRYDPVEGTATASAAQVHAGYVNGPRAPDWHGPLPGVFYAEWQEPHGRAALTVAPGPDRITQIAASGKRRIQIPINGRPGVLYLHHTYLVWQIRPDVTATLVVERGDAGRIIKIAQSIAPISPTDPRLHRP